MEINFKFNIGDKVVVKYIPLPKSDDVWIVQKRAYEEYRSGGKQLSYVCVQYLPKFIGEVEFVESDLVPWIEPKEAINGTA